VLKKRVYNIVRKRKLKLKVDVLFLKKKKLTYFIQILGHE